MQRVTQKGYGQKAVQSGESRCQRLRQARRVKSRSCPPALGSRGAGLAHASAQGDKPTVADTRRKFWEHYPFPLPSLWSTVVNELLVQQHICRYDSRYKYTALAALGLVSLFDQAMQSFPRPEGKEKIFHAFFLALDEDPDQYRRDHDALIESARSAKSVDGLAELDAIKHLRSLTDSNSFLYTKFHAVGLFTLLDCVDMMEPTSLRQLVDATGLSLDKVNSDLATYKDILSKLQQAQEMQQETIAREQQKREEKTSSEEAGETEGASS